MAEKSFPSTNPKWISLLENRRRRRRKVDALKRRGRPLTETSVESSAVEDVRMYGSAVRVREADEIR